MDRNKRELERRLAMGDESVALAYHRLLVREHANETAPRLSAETLGDSFPIPLAKCDGYGTIPTCDCWELDCDACENPPQCDGCVICVAPSIYYGTQIRSVNYRNARCLYQRIHAPCHELNDPEIECDHCRLTRRMRDAIETIRYEAVQTRGSGAWAGHRFNKAASGVRSTYFGA